MALLDFKEFADSERRSIEITKYISAFSVILNAPLVIRFDQTVRTQIEINLSVAKGEMLTESQILLLIDDSCADEKMQVLREWILLNSINVPTFLPNTVFEKVQSFLDNGDIRIEKSTVLAKALLDRDSTNDALDKFKEILGIEPDNIDAWTFIAYIQFCEGTFNPSRKTFERILQTIDKHDQVALLFIGASLLNLSRLDVKHVIFYFFRAKTLFYARLIFL